MKIYVTQAEKFKSYLNFITDWDRRKNISYHLQYIEFLYWIKKIHEPEYTTRSLLFKTIIIEYFTVIEAILDALLCQLQVNARVNDSYVVVPLDVNEYMRADRLLKLAKKYLIINEDMHRQLGQIKNIRNKIHIKRPHKEQPLEYEGYTEDMLHQCEEKYEAFLEYLFGKYNVIQESKYPWPWVIIEDIP